MPHEHEFVMKLFGLKVDFSPVDADIYQYNLPSGWGPLTLVPIGVKVAVKVCTLLSYL